MMERIPQIKADLAKIFILKNAKGEITFKSYLTNNLDNSMIS